MSNRRYACVSMSTMKIKTDLVYINLWYVCYLFDSPEKHVITHPISNPASTQQAPGSQSVNMDRNCENALLCMIDRRSGYLLVRITWIC